VLLAPPDDPPWAQARPTGNVDNIAAMIFVRSATDPDRIARTDSGKG